MTAVISSEAERMHAVARYDVLDSPPDRAFDRITQLVARLLDMPICLVSIVDTDRIWLKSKFGLDVDQIARTPGLCSSVILQADPWVVSNAVEDPRTEANPLVCGDFGLRFYAGVPLRTHDGHNLGALSVIDQVPRVITEQEVATLSDLAAVVVDELELRLAARTNIELQTQLREAAEDTAATLQEALLPPSLPEVAGIELASRYRAEEGQVGGDFYDVVPTPGGAAVMVGDVCGKGARAASFTTTARWTMRTILQDESSAAETLRRLNTVLTRGRTEAGNYCTVALSVLRARDDGGLDVRTALGGHPPAYVLRADGRVERTGGTGPIVGWLPDFDYDDTSIVLAPGDVMVLYTDGLLDAVCGRGAPDDAVFALLGGLTGRTAEHVARALETAVSTGAPTDDVAFVVLRAKVRSTGTLP